MPREYYWRPFKQRLQSCGYILGYFLSISSKHGKIIKKLQIPPSRNIVCVTCSHITSGRRMCGGGGSGSPMLIMLITYITVKFTYFISVADPDPVFFFLLEFFVK
jgi:hypothetical protein